MLVENYEFLYAACTVFYVHLKVDPFRILCFLWLNAVMAG